MQIRQRLLAWLCGFELLPTYFVALFRRWQDILGGVSVPTIVMVVWILLGDPPLWAKIIYLVSALFVAGYFVWRSEHTRFLPKLALKQRVYVTPTPNNPSGSSVWIQIVPKCLTDSPVEECGGHLLRVRKWQWSNNLWVSTELNETLPLGWSLGDYSPKTIHPGIDHRMNVFYIYDAEEKIVPCVPLMPKRAESVFNKTDVFRFDIKLTAKACKPVDVCVETKWGKKWDIPFVAIVPDPTTPPVAYIQRSGIE